MEPMAPPPPPWTPEALVVEQVFRAMGAIFHLALDTALSVLEVSPSSMAPLEVWGQQETEALGAEEGLGTAVEVEADTAGETLQAVLFATAGEAGPPTTSMVQATRPPSTRRGTPRSLAPRPPTFRRARASAMALL